MKRTTKDGHRKLGPETSRLIRGMRGGAAKIAVLSGINHAYISRVLSGKKPPSTRFWLGVDKLLALIQGQVTRAIILHEHPEIERGR